MSNLLFKAKMKKSDFVKKLVADFGPGLSYDIFHENMMDKKNNDFKVVTTTTYYLKGVHIASWGSGQGWIFDRSKNSQSAVS
jgi:hypothetical protein